MTRRTRPALLGLGCLLAVVGFSAAAQDEYVRFRHLTVRDGLSHNEVSAVIQDRQGFIWIGTERGLNRYDGLSFRWFFSGETGSGLSDSSITALAEGKDGLIWIGTANGGLSVFDPVSEGFRTFRHVEGLPESLAHDRVLSLSFGARGVLYVGTKGGLSELDVSSGVLASPRFRNSRAGKPGEGLLGNERVASVLEDSSGILWAGTKKGLSRRMPGATVFETFVFDKTNPHSLNDDEVYALAEDSSGDLWIGTWGSGGLSRLPSSERMKPVPRFQRFPWEPSDPRSPGGSIITAILEDPEGDVWFGSSDGGLGRLSRSERGSAVPRFLHYRPDSLDSTSLSSSSAVPLLTDKNGTLWVADGQSGISLWERQTEKLALYRPHPAGSALLLKTPVLSVMEDSSGRIWAGTGGGLSCITPARGPFEPARAIHFLEDEKNPRSLASGRVYALLEDGRGRVWVGTVQGGLHLLLPGGTGFLHFRGSKGVPDKLHNDTVLSLLEDASGTIWVGTYEGLYRLVEGGGDPSHFRFQAFHHAAGDPETLSHDAVESLHEDSRGRLWIGTYQGLNMMMPDRSGLKRILPKDDRLRSLSESFIHGVAEAADGRIWVATGNGGLVHYDPGTGTGRAFRESEGLSSRTVFGVTRDGRNRVWFPTPAGLHRFDPATSRIDVFGEKDGLHGDVGVRGAWFSGKSGRFYFGGPSGLSVFHPDDLVRDEAPPGVVLTGLFLSNRPVPVVPGGRISKQVGFLDRLVLEPRNSFWASRSRPWPFTGPSASVTPTASRGSMNRGSRQVHETAGPRIQTSPQETTGLKWTPLMPAGSSREDQPRSSSRCSLPGTRQSGSGCLLSS